MFAAFPTYKPSLPHPGANPNISSVTRERCPRAAGATRFLQRFQRSGRRCPHFQASPPDTAPTVSPVTRERFPNAAGAASMSAALPTYRPSLPHPGATPYVSSVTRERCTRAAGETIMFTVLPRYKPSLPRCPAAPRQRGTTPRVSAVTLGLCPRAAGATSMFSVSPTCEPSLSRCPASFPILLRTSLPSRASAAPRTGCNLHVCSLSNVQAVSASTRRYPKHLFRHARKMPPRSGRDAHFAALPTFTPSLPPLPRVAPGYCSNRLSRHARAFPQRSGCSLHVRSPSNVQAVSAPPRCYPKRLFCHA